MWEGEFLRWFWEIGKEEERERTRELEEKVLAARKIKLRYIFCGLDRPPLYMLSGHHSAPFHFLTYRGVKTSSVSLVRSIPMRSADMSPSLVREFRREARIQCPAPIASTHCSSKSRLPNTQS
ncbi:hypothetical protein BJX66DRAFT_319438 [Aspergillus keveii]|uniref:Uncharacterized protein n=1 Tax=Aspergillus keveii TaxID=714993 RepID=A0ABR4FI99_9EURO